MCIILSAHTPTPTPDHLTKKRTATLKTFNNYYNVLFVYIASASIQKYYRLKDKKHKLTKPTPRRSVRVRGVVNVV